MALPRWLGWSARLLICRVLPFVVFSTALLPLSLIPSLDVGRRRRAHPRSPFLRRVLCRLNAIAPEREYCELLKKARDDEQEHEELAVQIEPSLLPANSRAEKRRPLADSLATCPECSICLEGFSAAHEEPNSAETSALSVTSSGSSCRVLPCGHLFHAQCIEEWACRSALLHTDPSRYTFGPSGALEPQSPAPHCPLCKTLLDIIDARDVREAYVHALVSREREIRTVRRHARRSQMPIPRFLGVSQTDPELVRFLQNDAQWADSDNALGQPHG
mmetsp:Transcript_15652/g.42171  ORF Transcript_15652/g.42171 Transcript_15652/m.42171 type:complete len:275 (+) Transcript_15652:208-1032(+)